MYARKRLLLLCVLCVHNSRRNSYNLLLPYMYPPYPLLLWVCQQMESGEGGGGECWGGNLCCGSGFTESGYGSGSSISIWIRIQYGSRVLIAKNIKNTVEKIFSSKLQEKSSALKRKHPALQTVKFIKFLSFSGSFLPYRNRIRIWIHNTCGNVTLQLWEFTSVAPIRF